MQRHWKSPAHPERHRRDYIIYRAVEDASPDGQTGLQGKNISVSTSSRLSLSFCRFGKSIDQQIRERIRTAPFFLFHGGIREQEERENCAWLFIRGPR